MTEQTATQTIHIEGRRWFQRTYGNTYHSVRIFRDGEEIAYLPFQYGYGEQFLQTAFDWLAEHGYPELAERLPNGARRLFGTQYLRETMHGTYSIIDVTRKSDL